ncbi:MAG TPA: hypothetical protein VFY39_02465 [Gammaproteobacteria bacterium]|nr:hypothetical protein [Gammaproteobacteria bacterium]
MTRISTVVFDIGKVLLEWDPEHLYRRLIPDEAKRTLSLTEVCSPAWNLEQDRGGPGPKASPSSPPGIRTTKR